MKLTVWRVAAFFLLIALSIGFGFAFDAAATAVEKSRHPMPAALAEDVAKNAAEYGLPESVIWATLKCGSGFQSNARSEHGEIGLMQLTPAQFAYISEALLGKPNPDTGLLYDPATNLTCGTAYLSHLYEHYGVWEPVFAAYLAGAEAVDAWLTDPECVNAQGRLVNIPDKRVAAYVDRMTDAVAMYRNLYYKPQT